MDPTQLDQALLNLVANARSAMPDGGTLTIETAVTDSPGAASLWGQEPTMGGFAVLKVSDTGAGMTKEVQSCLFEPFFTTKSVGEGAGLGLATVYGIVKQSGGSVTVESEPGHGAVFSIYLPIANATPQAGPAARAEATPARPAPAEGDRPADRVRILVVDDDRVIRRSVSLFLKGAGYSVQEADQPERALVIAATDPVDLLVSDINMPTMTGPELARKMLLHMPQMRCILISGYGTDEVAGYRGAAGMGFLMKPFSKDQLLAAVRAQLER
jgi:two-component system cell cycle sensor histidine kinase/response regulator CckA